MRLSQLSALMGLALSSSAQSVRFRTSHPTSHPEPNHH